MEMAVTLKAAALEEVGEDVRWARVQGLQVGHQSAQVPIETHARCCWEARVRAPTAGCPAPAQNAADANPGRWRE